MPRSSMTRLRWPSTAHGCAEHAKKGHSETRSMPRRATSLIRLWIKAWSPKRSQEAQAVLSFDRTKCAPVYFLSFSLFWACCNEQKYHLLLLIESLNSHELRHHCAEAWGVVSHRWCQLEEQFLVPIGGTIFVIIIEPRKSLQHDYWIIK